MVNGVRGAGCGMRGGGVRGAGINCELGITNYEGAESIAN